MNSKYLLIEDDCALDSTEWFKKELSEKFNLRFSDFMNKGVKCEFGFEYNGYKLESFPDNCCWHLSSIESEMKILVLDIETTGFLQKGGSIVEIGIVELNLADGEIKEIYNSLCREEILTAKHREEPFGWIFRNSDLTIEEVRNAPSFDKVKEEVQMVINQYPLGCTAYNNSFDFGFLEDRGISFPKKLACPMRLSTNICKIPSTNGYGGYKWPSVEESFAFFFPEIEYKEKHRGADDAAHEAMIVHKLYQMEVFKIE